MQLQGVTPERLVAERIETENVPALPQEVFDHTRAKRAGFRRVRDLVLDLITRSPDAASDGGLAFRIAFELLPEDPNDVVRRACWGGAQTGGAGDR